MPSERSLIRFCVYAASMLVVFAAILLVIAQPSNAQIGTYQAQPDRRMNELQSKTISTATPTCEPSWHVVESPGGDGYENVLNAVAVVAANDIWAAGYVSNPFQVTLTEHWDGNAWSIVPSPNGLFTDYYLQGLAAISTNDVWAVGSYRASINGSQTLIEHWDGNAWSIVPSPSSGQLWGVAAISSSDVWAVGNLAMQALILHWDGSAWSAVPAPAATDSILISVTAVGPNDVWAVGNQFEEDYEPLVMHWNGVSWNIVPSPGVQFSNDTLWAVSAVAANDIWAVGTQQSAQPLTLVEHWDGNAWSIVPSPNGSDMSELRGISVNSANDIWAVGYKRNTEDYIYHTFVEHWEGSVWNIVPSPDANTSDNRLNAAAIVGPNNVWSAGYYDDNGIAYRTLTEQYSVCPAATNTPTPSATIISATPTSTPGAVLVGHVRWQGPPAQPDSRQRLLITLTLKLGATEVNYPSQNTDASGFITVPVSGLAAGTYNWRGKGPRYLASVGIITLAGAPTTQAEMGQMSVADASNDNRVNAMDFNILKVTFGLGSGDPGYDARADFDNNNVINTTDFNLLKINFGQGGAPPIGPGLP